ncbi:Nitric oxide synthase-interacting protein E3 ubiquitin-protein ligase NOSIP [Takifugu flavidus]|uniref:Nitric oxide synthase-interacting protein E3 ubiquitin-protein ligase NOSIP n=1 Tax=Takifugu flavidus TaxID=433684 RepID=A0A5C6NFM6_9TELE|nr:Nitric oxide synthase-interacting protein E3 ubiquitin-protein ligase NOSIP [Takifugu flavidus]
MRCMVTCGSFSSAASGYGTQSIRLGKDAIKDFDCCCLSLQPCQDPVVTYAYEKQKQTRKSTTQLQSKSGEREKVEKFKTTENSIVSKPINPFMFVLIHSQSVILNPFRTDMCVLSPEMSWVTVFHVQSCDPRECQHMPCRL